MINSDNTLIIRTDANAIIGTGHLMRCLALAQAWKDQGGDVIFITACDSPELLRRLAEEGFQVVELEKAYPDDKDWEKTRTILGNHPGDWVVLDGYHFDLAYQRLVKEVGHPLLVIDDTAHIKHYYANIVLNQNIHATKLPYSCEPYTNLLLGTDYVLLRREFWSWRNWERVIPDHAHKLLITLGGGDSENQTMKVICAVKHLNAKHLETKVIVGASNPHFGDLVDFVKDMESIQIIRNVTDMPTLMSWADIAVTAGGSTCWELAFMSLPAVILVLAENQIKTSNLLSNSGVFISLGQAKNVEIEEIRVALTKLLVSPNDRKLMSSKGKLLVDGFGSMRVISSMDYM